MINIIIRTSGRPEYFKSCIESIERQTYKKYKIIVGIDTGERYANKYKPVRYKMLPRDKPAIQLNGYRTVHFPFNLYLNRLMEECDPGWIMFLDDDDALHGINALREIALRLTEKTQAAFWRVKIRGRIVPSEANFRERPVVKDISMIGFCFHSEYIPLMQFDCYKQADYRIANRIYSILKPVWIDKVLTETQCKTSDGAGNRHDKNYQKFVKVDKIL